MTNADEITGTDPKGGSGGGGLLAALDVMTFANDLDFSSAASQKQNVSKPISPSPDNICVAQKETFSECLIEDPLRQLVIFLYFKYPIRIKRMSFIALVNFQVLLSEEQKNNNVRQGEEEFLTLAKAAASNEDFEEIPPKICQYGWNSELMQSDLSVLLTKKGGDNSIKNKVPIHSDFSDSDGLVGEHRILSKKKKIVIYSERT